jgi:predicted MPP superfamily phosphohydrolase
MSPFVVIVFLILIGDAVWWMWADRQLRRGRKPWPWRVLLGLFTAVMFGYVAFFILFPTQGRRAHLWMPAWPLAAVYLWHLLILPITLLLIGLASVPRVITAAWRKPAAPPQEGPTRRQILTAAAIAIPPLVTAGAVTRGLSQIHNFRIRRLEIPLAQLPKQLDGLTIAQVSDVHVGRFTRPHMLPRIADATNQLKADLVLLTGDLIDLSLADLPAGLDFVRKLDPRSGLFMCEGNHDLIDDPFAFESRVKASGVPLLLDDNATLTVRGVPVQLLGMTWSRGNAGIIGAMNRLLPQRHEECFQILLAHHPHAFDPAAAIGIPLTLAGHTHGGQLMLNERLGAGPVMFKYWSGLYRQNDSAMVVSNGVGNWFPLRLDAPAEIVHITLRRATS